MQAIGNAIRRVVVAALLAATIAFIVSLPGFLSDRNSTVPASPDCAGQR